MVWTGLYTIIRRMSRGKFKYLLYLHAAIIKLHNFTSHSLKQADTYAKMNFANQRLEVKYDI